MNADGPYREDASSSPEPPPFEPLRVFALVRGAVAAVASWPLLLLNVFAAWAHERYTGVVTVAYGVPKWMRQRPRRIAWWFLQIGFRKALTLSELLPVDQNGTIAPFAWMLFSVALYGYPVLAWVLVHDYVGHREAYFAAGAWVVYRVLIEWLRLAMRFDEWPAYNRWEEWFLRA